MKLILVESMLEVKYSIGAQYMNIQEKTIY